MEGPRKPTVHRREEQRSMHMEHGVPRYIYNSTVVLTIPVADPQQTQRESFSFIHSFIYSFSSHAIGGSCN